MIRELGQQLHQVRWAALGKDAQSKLLLCLLANLSVAVAVGFDIAGLLCGAVGRTHAYQHRAAETADIDAASAGAV